MNKTEKLRKIEILPVQLYKKDNSTLLIESNIQFQNYETENFLVLLLVCFKKSKEDSTTNFETTEPKMP